MSKMEKESSFELEDSITSHSWHSPSKETCLKLPKGIRDQVIDARWIQKKRGSSYNPEQFM